MSFRFSAFVLPVLACCCLTGCLEVTRVEWLLDSSGFVVHHLNSNRVVVYDIASGDANQFAGGGLSQVALSPDGRMIATVELVRKNEAGEWQRQRPPFESDDLLLLRKEDRECELHDYFYHTGVPYERYLGVTQKLLEKEFPDHPQFQSGEATGSGPMYFRLRVTDRKGIPLLYSAPFKYSIEPARLGHEMIVSQPYTHPTWGVVWHPAGRQLALFSCCNIDGGSQPGSPHFETHLYNLDKHELKHVEGVFPWVWSDPLMMETLPFSPGGEGFLALKTTDSSDEPEFPGLVWVNWQGEGKPIENEKALIEQLANCSLMGLLNPGEQPAGKPMRCEWGAGVLEIQSEEAVWTLDLVKLRFEQSAAAPLKELPDHSYSKDVNQFLKAINKSGPQLGMQPELRMYSQYKVSPDGRYLIVTAPKEKTIEFKLFDRTGTQVKLSPSFWGKLQGRGGSVEDWDARQREIGRRFYKHKLADAARLKPRVELKRPALESRLFDGAPGATDFSRDCRTIAVNREQEVKIVTLGQGFQKVEKRSEFELRKEADSILLSPDLTRLMVLSNSLSIWDTPSGKRLVRHTKAANGRIENGLSTLAFSPDGKQLFSFGGSGQSPEFLRWEIPAEFDSQVLSSESSPGRAAQRVTRSADHQSLTLSSDADWSRVKWDGEGWAETHQGKPGGYRQVVMLPDQSALVMATYTGRVIVKPVPQPEIPVLFLDQMTMPHPSDDPDRSPPVWHTVGDYTLKSNGDPSLHIAVSDDAKWVAAVRGLELYLWRTDGYHLVAIVQPEGAELKEFPRSSYGNPTTVGGMTFSPDSNRILHVAPDGVLRIWNLPDLIPEGMNDNHWKPYRIPEPQSR